MAAEKLTGFLKEHVLAVSANEIVVQEWRLQRWFGEAVSGVRMALIRDGPTARVWSRASTMPRSVSLLFYVTGIVPLDRGAKQLSQRSNAELFFRSGAVRLDGFQTKIQIPGNLRRAAALAE